MNAWFQHAGSELCEALLQQQAVILWQEVEGTVWDARQAARALSAALLEAVGIEGLFVSRTGTAGLAGVAACAWCPIGLDAEHGSPNAMDAAVRARALHPDEAATEHLMAGQDDPEPFFGLWARKEAVLKALGTGLGLDPRLVAVGWPAASWQRVTSPAGDHLEVRSISAPNTTPAALAVRFGHLASVSDRVRREVPQYDPTLRRLSVGVRNTQIHKALAGVAQGHRQNPACPPRLSQHLVPCHDAAV
ncbi:hypothetical protein MNBD_PLANCTO03-1184 [hydrothermal vent metagenome]|uniref:4'-phosphopantetheinyl transferase domain-containing protein n=1 Tax=hydrothermal vent metagenome TaxID=652676 RepID=A0A3B1DJH0_9ZZZZ